MTDQTEETVDAPEAEIEAVETTEPEQVDAQAETETEAVEKTVVTFGDDEAPEQQDAPDWVKNVRKENRELNKQLKDLKKQAAAGKADEKTDLGPEPTIEQFDYDSAKHIAAVREWDKAKAKQDAKANEAKEAQEKQGQAYNARLSEYQEGKGAFDADQFDEAEDAVKGALSENQQTILIHAFGGKAAPLIQGLGQDEKRLKELGTITDPIAFAVAATRLETAMKVSQRRPKTVPETRTGGNIASGASSDKTLEKLRAEAAQTNDMSKVLAYKRKLKAG
jgi:hypothetical protein